MVDHFHEQVIAKNKIGGAARAMVVTNGIDRAVQYFHAIRDYLQERKSQYRAVVAFSGEPEFGGQKVTEVSLNGFPSGQIAQKIREDPYRFLVCADKFQTGYDEPLLHTMYVDKTLSGIKAVQTLSRLNRAHPKKHDVFVASSAESVGEFWFGQGAKCVIQSDFQCPGGAEPIRPFGDHSGLPVEAFDNATGELPPGSEPVQDQVAVRAHHAGNILHREPRAHRPSAPAVEELSGPVPTRSPRAIESRP